MKRIVIVVLDSVGVGSLPDAHIYGDEGSNIPGKCVPGGWRSESAEHGETGARQHCSC